VVATEDLVAAGVSNGAAAVGVCPAVSFDYEMATLLAHRESGRSGPLHFTYQDPEVASDVRRTHPWARSLVSVAVDYLPRTRAPGAKGPLVARFATDNHYRLLESPMAAISSLLEAGGWRTAALVDDNRLLDRAPATRSGVGWRGRNTMVLTPGHGPWTLVGTVVTDADLAPSAPMRRDCGSCTACLPACPTGALDDEGLDARRCLSTWLQTGGSIPLWIRPLLGRRIYGCDDCLTACPPGFPAMDKNPRPTSDLRFDDLLTISDERLLERFSWWYVPHRDPRILRRNLLVAAGNSGEAEAEGWIEPYLTHRSALLRGHAAWGLARAAGGAAVGVLDDRSRAETEPNVVEEILIALEMVEWPHHHAERLRQDEASQMGRYPAGMMSDREPATGAIRALRKAGIAYEPHLFDYDRYPGARGAAEAIGVDLHLTVKTIVFETSDGGGVIALMNGDREVSAKTLARHLDVKSVRPAGPDRARKWTGYEFGGTSPFGMRQQLPVYAHSEIAAMDRIYVNAGSRGFLVAMDPTELIRVLTPVVVDLAV
jgi:epoxyqueuosine reductase